MSKLPPGAIMLLVGALSSWSMPVRAQSPAERLTDRDVKRLIDQVDEGRDEFKDNLDSKLKSSTVRGPGGEINVSNLLQDYQDNTKKLRNRFDDNYAASVEVATVLKQAASIDSFMQGTSSVTKGRQQWDSEAASLRHLAGAYGATFPLAEGAVVHRMNDKETAAAAAAVSEAADRFKKDLDTASTLAKLDRDAAHKDIEQLIKHADAVKDHTNDDQPAMAEVRQLVEQAAKIRTFVGTHQVPTASWQTVQTSLEMVRQAFGLPK